MFRSVFGPEGMAHRVRIAVLVRLLFGIIRLRRRLAFEDSGAVALEDFLEAFVPRAFVAELPLSAFSASALRLGGIFQ